MSDLSSLPQSEAIVIAEIARTHGEFMDEIEISTDDFLTNEASWAFETMRKMANSGTPIDTMSVGISDPRVEQYLWRISELPGYAAAFHADLVHQAATRRRLDAVGASIRAEVGTANIEELMDRARRQIDDAAGLRRQPLTFVGDLIDEAIADAERPRLVYPSPWRSLDDVLGGGFRPGALYTLAARPGIGKSAIALQIATALAQNGPVAFSSLEMPKEELVRRIISQGVQMPHHLLERGQPMPALWRGKVEMWKDLAPHSIAIDDRSTVTMSDVRAFARNVRRPSGKIAGVLVDYLQLMSGPSGASRYEIVTENARQMKIMARELECPVIMLSQLNRNSESRMDRRPMLSDLRDSGAVEQDSDVVMMLYRDPDFEQAPPDAPPLPVPLELNVGKNRHGPTMTVTLNWEGTQMRAY
jgi:replicative DNA helicase